MPQVGDLHTPRIDVPDGEPGTHAVLAMLDPDDGSATLAVEADPDHQTFLGPELRFVEPGEWRFLWTVTGAGATRITQVVAVDPDPHALPAGFSHATTGDLARYSGKPLPPAARRLLIDASVEIDRLTRTAVYTTDPATGRATDPRLRAALAEATCELIGWWDETGTATGSRALFTSASIAGVSLGFGGGGAQANPQADRIGPRVWSILLGAGLINTGAVGVHG
jgi:hypothetical protein